MDIVDMDFAGKKEYVQSVFESIAPVYDRMNQLLSWGLLKSWRRLAVAEAAAPYGGRVLDVCTGTAGLLLLLAEQVGAIGEAVGLDSSEKMLEIARRKLQSPPANTALILGDALDLPFAAGSFDCVTMGFALRNVTDLQRALSEMCRVCRKGGRVVCLEISEPVGAIWRAGFRLYFYHLVPLFGGLLVERDAAISQGAPAYTWLAQSLKGFPQGREMTRLLEEAGLAQVRHYPLSGGVVSIYRGVRQ